MIQSGKIYIRGRTVVFMIIRNEQDLEGLRKIGRIVALAREEMKKEAKPGMTTKELDLIGKKVLDEHGAISAPEKEYDFPGVTCISVNEEVAHGIPGDRVLKEGDLVNVDYLQHLMVIMQIQVFHLYLEKMKQKKSFAKQLLMPFGQQ